MAADRDRQRWDLRHQGGTTDPMPPFGAEHLPDDRSGWRCLDVAAGTGGISLWAAEQGMTVTSIDISSVGLAALRDGARAAGLDHRITTIEHDLDTDLGVAGQYELVVCRYFRNPARYAELAAAMAHGGWLSISVLRGGGSYAAEEGELEAAFGEPVDLVVDDRAQHALFRRAD